MITNHPGRRDAAYWRLAVVLALALYGLMAFSVIRFVVLNPLLAVIFILTVVALVYAAWLVFSSRGKSKAEGYALLVLGLAGLLLELSAFADPSRRGLVAFGVLAISYLLVVAVLRHSYWGERRELAAMAATSTKTRDIFKHPVLIINPKSGGGRAVKAHVDQLAAGQGINVVFTEPDKDVAATAREAVEAGADVLGISGGDGSIGAVAKVAMENDLPIVVLPGGTRCHFARDLGMDPKRIADALTAFNGVERRVDVGSINGRIFLNNASFGLYADIVDHPEYRGHKLDVGRAVLQEIAAGDKEPYELKFALDGKQFDRAVMVLIGVNRYESFNLLEPLRRQRMDGGVLQVSVVSKLNNELIRRLLRGASTSSMDKVQGIYQGDVQSIQLSARSGSIIAGVDGENEAYATPVQLKIQPGALRVYVPPEGERSRPINTFSREMVRKMWKTGLSGRP